MLSYIQGMLLGILQGVTELFPISSLGHSVILPQILGWNIDQGSPFFLMFLVATHFATALVLLIFFWKDWMKIVSGIFRSLKEREIKESDPYAKLGWLLVVGTIPAGILGLAFKDVIQKYLLSAPSAAVFLALNGVLLFVAELLRRKAPPKGNRESDVRIAAMSWSQGFKVGLMQILALMPGFSRTGSTIAGSLMVGLSHEDSLRFSFLLSTPIIGAAAALELPALLSSGNGVAVGISVVGGLFAALFSYLSVRFLTVYFKLENHKLTPFAIYCLLAGVISFVLLH